ncbi:MAG TPA: ExbD/TolR family protein [Caulobacteraceae bacterium]|nr:ExbD/TolR family protein [Caulobacteraceae bacterium]
MALSIHDPFQAAGGRRRSRRSRRAALSEINVTPLVDVMLVLLIIFMISAPLLTVGVPLQLPKTEAGAMQDQSEPLTVSVRADGSIYLNQTEVPFTSLSPALTGMAGQGMKRPIYVRADGRAPYAIVAQVMAALSSSGFSQINLITDTGGPSSGPKPPPEVGAPDQAPSP